MANSEDFKSILELYNQEPKTSGVSIVLRMIKDVFTKYNQSNLKNFDYDDIVIDLNSVDDSEKSKSEFAFEQLAFRLQPQHGDNPWGHYHYGPQFTFGDANGLPVYSPAIDDITSESVVYWKGRLADCVNPLLKLRYATLVWDFQPSICRQSNDGVLYRTIVDAALEDFFLTCYIPVFDKVLSFVDMPNYPYWTFNWAMAGTSKISVERYDKLEELNSFLQRISYHQGYEVYDNLLRNLGILVSDYIDLCNEHIKEFGTEEYTIDRFYTKIPDNPNYENLLNEFNEYCRLICDMTLELTRLLNLLLERIRERVPDYHIDEGIFVIDSIAREKTQYRNSEKSDTPYPGLKQFVKIRKTRNYCYSKTEELGFLY